MTPASDVIVVGAGLMGCSSALHLALRGKRVTVLDRHHAGRHASGVNAGGVRRLGRHPAEIPLSVEALRIWQHIEELVGDGCGFLASGQVRVAENEDELREAETRAARVRALGYDHEEVVGRDELRRLVPAIAGHCVGALVSRADGHASPYHTTQAFRRRALGLGVQFREGVAVQQVEQSAGGWTVSTDAGPLRSEVLLNCAGAWGAGIARMTGDPVTLAAEALMMMVTARVPRFVEPVVGAFGRKLSFKQARNGTVIIGGAHRGRVDHEGFTTTLDFDALAVSARTVNALFPSMRGVPVVRCWAGIEGMTPDGIPVIGPSRSAPGAFHAFGFSAHGFALAPVIGRVMSELVCDGTSSLPIDPFRVTRFNEAPG